MNYGSQILFLDDTPERRRKFLSKYPAAKCVSTVKDCIEWLQKGDFVTLFLDHDLGGEVFVDSDREDCGAEACRWLTRNTPPHLAEIILHSHNPMGVSVMLELLKPTRYQVYAVRFGEGKLFA